MRCFNCHRVRGLQEGSNNIPQARGRRSMQLLQPWKRGHKSWPGNPPNVPQLRAMDLMDHWQPCFWTVSAILIVLSTVVATDAVGSFHVQSDSKYRPFEIGFSSWVVENGVPRTWQSTQEPSCSWLPYLSLFLFIFLVSQPGFFILSLRAIKRGTTINQFLFSPSWASFLRKLCQRSSKLSWPATVFFMKSSLPTPCQPLNWRCPCIHWVWIAYYLREIVERQTASSTGFVFVDLSKAFDRVNQALIDLLSGIGICDAVKKWFANYLSDRQQRVRVGNRFSSQSAACSRGIPQGSVLGPLLFTLYVRDLPSCVDVNPLRAIHTWIRRTRRIRLHIKGWFSICQVWQ